MFLRLEILGHYLEIGKTEDAQPEPVPTIADTQYPMTISTQPLGFRVIGPDEYIEDQQ